MSEPARGRVLCVDDQPDAALSLTTLLSLHGYVARACHDGPTALTLAEKFRPTACVLDIVMPGMDGCELAVKLRELLGEDTLMVAVTGHGGEEVTQRATSAGFHWVMTKPADPDDLLIALGADESAAKGSDAEAC